MTPDRPGLGSKVLRLTRAAESDIDSIIDYVANEAGIEIATTFADRIDSELANLAELGHGGLTYARIDGVIAGGRLRLMEAELIEPQLFLSAAPHGAANFARALSDALRAR